MGEGNDEEIIMQLDAIPPPTCICVLTINSYSGDTFANVNRAFVKVSNAVSKTILHVLCHMCHI